MCVKERAQLRDEFFHALEVLEECGPTFFDWPIEPKPEQFLFATLERFCLVDTIAAGRILFQVLKEPLRKAAVRITDVVCEFAVRGVRCPDINALVLGCLSLERARQVSAEPRERTLEVNSRFHV